MKIAINATILGKKPSGLGVYTTNIIKGIESSLSTEDQLLVYTSTPEHFEESKKIQIVKTPKYMSPEYGKIGGLTRFIWNQVVLPFRVKKDKVDIIYSTTHHGMFLSPIKQILTVHDLLPIIFPGQHKLQYYYFKYILPLLLKKSSRLVTVSSNTKEDILKSYKFNKSKIDVVYNSFEKTHFKNSTSSKYKDMLGEYILFLGASYPHKNLIRTIKAFNKIKTKHPDLNLVVAGGRADYKDQVMEHFKNDNEALNRVVFLDYIPYSDLPILYSNATLFIYPSLYEGFGIPPIEAMACGCPTIVSNTSSLPEVCNNASIYFNPEDINEISSTIINVLKDNQIQEDLIQKGYENCNRFSWDMSASKVYTLIKGDGSN